MTTATEALARLVAVADDLLANPSMEVSNTLALAQHVLDSAAQVDADGPPPPPADFIDSLKANRQIEALAHVIANEIEGEPSQSQGAVATAIRLLRAGQYQADGRILKVLAEAAEALRLTAEYVGPDGLPAVEGWSWWDALVPAREALGWDVLPADWRLPAEEVRADEPSDPFPNRNECCPARLLGWAAPDYDDTAWRTERTTDVRFTADRDSDGRSWAAERSGWTPADPADRHPQTRNEALEDTLADLGTAAGRIIACGVLIAHQRDTKTSGCLCGWGQPGSTPTRVGDSYAEHLIDSLEANGVEIVYLIDPTLTH